METVMQMDKSTREEYSDNELALKFSQGDERAFSLIVLRYQKRLIQVATAILGDEDEAMDIAQETFVRAYGNRTSFRADSSVYTWLYRILYNLCISAIRKKKIVSFLSFDSQTERIDYPSTDSGPDEPCERKEILMTVKAALQELPVRQRTVFSMKQLEGLKHEEIAKVMGISVGAVKASYFHAVQKLRESLKHFGGDHGMC